MNHGVPLQFRVTCLRKFIHPWPHRCHWRRSTASPLQSAIKINSRIQCDAIRVLLTVTGHWHSENRVDWRCIQEDSVDSKNLFYRSRASLRVQSSDESEMFACPSARSIYQCNSNETDFSPSPPNRPKAINFAFKRFSRSNNERHKEKTTTTNGTNRFVSYFFPSVLFEEHFILVSTDFFGWKTMNNLWSPSTPWKSVSVFNAKQQYSSQCPVHFTQTQNRLTFTQLMPTINYHYRLVGYSWFMVMGPKRVPSTNIRHRRRLGRHCFCVIPSDSGTSFWIHIEPAVRFAYWTMNVARSVERQTWSDASHDNLLLSNLRHK